MDDVVKGNLANPVIKEPEGAIIGSVDPDSAQIFIDENRLHLFAPRQQVESSNIKSIGHVLSRKILIVEFRDGSIYTYKNVPRHVYEDCLEAPSKGKYFYRHIQRKYASTKVEDYQ
jgi:hypothetical protein